MALKQLKHSMIIEGTFYSFGTVLDDSEVPPNFRKPKYLTEPEDEEVVLSEYEEVEQEESFDDVMLEDEKLPPTTIPSDSRAKYFKPKKK